MSMQAAIAAGLLFGVAIYALGALCIEAWGWYKSAQHEKRIALPETWRVVPGTELYELERQVGDYARKRAE